MAKEFDPSEGKHEYQDLYSAPRRFDLATMLVVTSAFALLFTGMTVLNFPFWAFVYYSSLIATIGIAQSVFASKKDPRSISIIAGVAYHVLLLILIPVLLTGVPNLFSDSGSDWPTGALFCSLIAGAIFSPATGYLGGVLVAGTFLVADYLRSLLGLLHLNRNAADKQSENNSPWDD